MKKLLYIVIGLVVLFFAFNLMIGANPLLALQSLSYSYTDHTSRLQGEISPTPIATEADIDEMAHRYFDNHVSMAWFSEQFDNDKLTSEGARKIIGECLDTFKEKEKCEAVINKEYWIGMPLEWAVNSLGSPDDKNSTVFSTYRHDQFIYGNPLNGATYLYFEDGVLTSYQN